MPVGARCAPPAQFVASKPVAAARPARAATTATEDGGSKECPAKAHTAPAMCAPEPEPVPLAGLESARGLLCEIAAVQIVTRARDVPAELLEYWATAALRPRATGEGGPSRPRSKMLPARGRVHRFVSHTWAVPPPERHGQQLLKTDPGADFACQKMAQLATELRERASQEVGTPWEKLSCWVDKSCVPEEGREAHLAHIEQFLQLCDGLIVLLSRNYFERLWCCYEWAMFLAVHPGSAVAVRMVPLPDSIQPWVDAVAHLRTKDLACESDGDRQLLLAKVQQCFRGSGDECFRRFDRFVQFSAVALVAAGQLEYCPDERILLRRFVPWIELAERLLFRPLAQALRRLTEPSDAKPEVPQACYWHFEAHANAQILHARIRTWLCSYVLPLVEAERRECVRPHILQQLEQSALESRKPPPAAGLATDKKAMQESLNCFNRVGGAQGSIDKRDFRKVHETIMGKKGGLRLTESTATSDPIQLFKDLDLNRDDRIDASEWERYMAAVYDALGKRDFQRLVGNTQMALGRGR